MARRRIVASNNTASTNSNQTAAKSRLSSMLLNKKKRKDITNRQKDIDTLNVVSKSLYDGNDVREQRDWKTHWKARKIIRPAVTASATPLTAKEYETRMKQCVVLGADSKSKW